MSLNTAEKRRSALGVSLRVPGVTPNAGGGAEWRRQIGYAPSSLVVVPSISTSVPSKLQLGQARTNPVTGGTSIGW